MERDYAPQGVKFFYIYKSLAHPEHNGYITPFTLDERLMHVSEAKRTLGSRITWICDSMDNDLKHALGNAPNSEFIVDPEGVIVRARQWSRPDELRSDLEELVGAVESPTRVADLNMPRQSPPERAPTGIVPRLELPGGMSPVVVEPQSSGGEHPYYVKLRAEMSVSGGNARGSPADGRSGRMYLGFFLDPLYQVHWNNQVDPLRYEIDPPPGIQITPLTGEGPQVEEKADADPREFLLEFQGRSSEPLRVTVHYFACDDAETFCLPLTQEYLVYFERDRDGGSRRSFGGAGRRGPPGVDGAGGPPPRRRFDRDVLERRRFLRDAVGLIRERDADGDGALNEDEWQELDGQPAEADRDGDGVLSLQEVVRWLQRRADR